VQAVTRETGDVVLFTEATRCLLKTRKTGVYAEGEAELRVIAEPVALYSVATDLDERSTPRRKSLITDA
jgi:class 3 adenylate cyclase